MRPVAVTRAQRIESPAEVARPFVAIAASFFAAGFWGYVALAPLVGR